MPRRPFGGEEEEAAPRRRMAFLAGEPSRRGLELRGAASASSNSKADSAMPRRSVCPGDGLAGLRPPAPPLPRRLLPPYEMLSDEDASKARDYYEAHCQDIS